MVVAWLSQDTRQLFLNWSNRKIAARNARFPFLRRPDRIKVTRSKENSNSTMVKQNARIKMARDNEAERERKDVPARRFIDPPLSSYLVQETFRIIFFFVSRPNNGIIFRVWNEVYSNPEGWLPHVVPRVEIYLHWWEHFVLKFPRREELDIEERVPLCENFCARNQWRVWRER